MTNEPIDRLFPLTTLISMVEPVKHADASITFMAFFLGEDKRLTTGGRYRLTVTVGETKRRPLVAHVSKNGHFKFITVYSSVHTLLRNWSIT
jgi:hypothetical protein